MNTTPDGLIIHELPNVGSYISAAEHNYRYSEWQSEKTRLEQRVAEMEGKLANEAAYIKKMDGIIEEVGGVTASCINPYEDLKMALTQQKLRAESAEAALVTSQKRISELEADVKRFRDLGYQGAEQLAAARRQLEEMGAAMRASTKQLSFIEDFLWRRKYCTELYISPLGFHGGESWQVELNYGAVCEAYQGDCLADALSKAFIAAAQRAALAPVVERGAEQKEAHPDTRRIDQLEAHPLNAQVHGGSADGGVAKVWAISCDPKWSLRQAIDMTWPAQPEQKPNV